MSQQYRIGPRHRIRQHRRVDDFAGGVVAQRVAAGTPGGALSGGEQVDQFIKA